MKKITLFYLFLFLSFPLFAGKYIIFTDRVVEAITLIDKTKSKNEILKPSTTAPNSFEFEALTVKNIFLKAPELLNLKIYSLNENTTSTWFKLNKEESIPVELIMKKMKAKKLSLSEFYTTDFINSPVTSKKPQLRSLYNVFLSSNNQAFNSIKEVYLVWKKDLKNVEIKLLNATTFTVICTFSYENKRSLQVSDIPKKFHKALKQAQWIQIDISGICTEDIQEQTLCSTLYFRILGKN